jgi:hypothetical protein
MRWSVLWRYATGIKLSAVGELRIELETGQLKTDSHPLLSDTKLIPAMSMPSACIPDRKFLTSASTKPITLMAAFPRLLGLGNANNPPCFLPQFSSRSKHCSTEPSAGRYSYPITGRPRWKAGEAPAVCAIVYETKRYDYIDDVPTGNYSIITPCHSVLSLPYITWRDYIAVVAVVGPRVGLVLPSRFRSQSS